MLALVLLAGSMSSFQVIFISPVAGGLGEAVGWVVPDAS